MRYLIILLLLTTFSFAQGQGWHAFKYNGSQSRISPDWVEDTTAVAYDVTGSDSIYSIPFQYTNHNGLFFSDVYAERISGTTNIVLKVQVWSDAINDWGDKQTLELRRYEVSDSSSVVPSDTISNTYDDTLLFWTTAPLLADSKYGWPDNPIVRARWWAIFTGTQKGRLSFKPVAHQTR